MNSSDMTTYSFNDSSASVPLFLNQSENQVDTAAEILNTFVGPIICIFGICGNILNLVILVKGNLNESPYLYLKLLAMTDMCALILSLVWMSISRTCTQYAWQLFNVFVYFPLVNFFMAVSVWLTVGVTMDRFVYVKSPLWARGYCSVNRARSRIVCIVILALLITIPRFFCYRIVGNKREYYMKATWFRGSNYYRTYDIICIVLFHAAPLFIFIVCNAYLICAVYRARSIRRENDIRNNKEKEWQKDQRRFTITLIAIVLSSIIAIIPSTIGDFTQLLGIPVDKYQKLRRASNVLLLCNLSMNFLFYCAFNKRFVRVMKSIFCGTHSRFGFSVIRTRSTRFSKVDRSTV